MITNSQENTNELRRPDWQWYSILLLFVIVFIVGIFSLLLCQNPFTTLFAVTGFSIAFAIHYFDISTSLNTIFIREDDREKRRKLREMEYGIVTSGMLVLGGGLCVLLAAGVGMLLSSLVSHVFTLILTLFLYMAGALSLLFGVARYIFCQRGWPKQAQEIIEKKSQD